MAAADSWVELNVFARECSVGEWVIDESSAGRALIRRTTSMRRRKSRKEAVMSARDSRELHCPNSYRRRDGSLGLAF
jgi:hypothetical protein